MNKSYKMPKQLVTFLAPDNNFYSSYIHVEHADKNDIKLLINVTNLSWHAVNLILGNIKTSKFCVYLLCNVYSVFFDYGFIKTDFKLHINCPNILKKKLNG